MVYSSGARAGTLELSRGGGGALGSVRLTASVLGRLGLALVGEVVGEAGLGGEGEAGGVVDSSGTLIPCGRFDAC